MVLVFGPMYHLYTKEDKVKALKEAKRVVKPGGIILVAYCMNEYSILTYGFKEGHMKESIRNQKWMIVFMCDRKRRICTIMFESRILTPLTRRLA